MKEFKASGRLVMAAFVAVVGFGACFAEPNGLAGVPTASGGASPSDGGAPVVSVGGMAGADAGPVCVARAAVKGAECGPVTASEQLRQRVVENVPVDVLYFTETLFGEFKSVCGACHVASDLGGFHATSSSFPVDIDEKVLSAMHSETPSCELDSQGHKQDPNCYSFMPPDGTPNGKPWSQRKDVTNDPVTRLADKIEQWIKAGRPPDAFTLRDESGGPYAIDAETAETFTNLGTCLPDAGMVATELEKSCELDAKFAAMEKKLDSTLGVEQVGLPATLDQTDLFTLDSAELARHGVIAYAPAYPLWTDDAGKLRYVRVPQGTSIRFDRKTKEFEIPKNTRFYKTFMKKMLDLEGVERFRKIETRVIVSRPGEGSLFGTYLWNEQETQATLHTDPFNDTLPFKDKVLVLVKDEAKAAAVYADWKAGKVRNYSKELDYQGLTRRYAVPSSDRCVQCHMGGPGASFILGFMPLDVSNTRQCDRATLDAQAHCDGGLYEPALGDELTQLERLISYGVVTGYELGTDDIKLEDPQAAEHRLARTPEELTAQGYMLGNCSHCHNPNGYPSVLNPELKPLLNFRPNEQGGGIFEFPLERYSPRIDRQQGNVQLPYITPSLRDVVSTSALWTPKQTTVKSSLTFIDAPWRSLIYRNVDTPFTYADDEAIFPHMPLNSPGFDCRAPRFLGEWMVSIPAVRKHSELVEDVGKETSPALADNDPQPYAEVLPTEPEYGTAVIDAQARLEKYRNGLRGNNYCPDTKDIVDLVVVNSGGPYPKLIPEDGEAKGLPREGVPDRPHWVVTDLTDPPGPWNPRRSDWEKVLVKQDFSTDEAELAKNFSGEPLRQHTIVLNQQKVVAALLKDLKPSAGFMTYAQAMLPFGIWQANKKCDFAAAGIKAADQIKPADRPRWMTASPPPNDAPIYETLPGAAVFGMICINCHGPDADSTGRQATTLQEMTGGLGRVANFRNGFFGAFGKGGENRQRVFGSDEMAMRYLPWMALGGTKTQIPLPILNLVAATRVLGIQRPAAPPVTNANMLETARALCRSVVTRGQNSRFDPWDLDKPDAAAKFQKEAGFLFTNGDAALWETLCTFDNPSPIHTITAELDGDNQMRLTATNNYFQNAAYPSGAAVGNIRGAVEASLAPSNSFPWCVVAPTDAAKLVALHKLKGSDGSPLPECPPALLETKNQLVDTDPAVAVSDVDRFATRGAINAGFAVFVYLDRMISQGKGRILGYNECEQLKPAGTP
jgi:mono/diheme cytochrome c family protein